jgi:hypothetical protein
MGSLATLACGDKGLNCLQIIGQVNNLLGSFHEV